jgi:hypothetical protein
MNYGPSWCTNMFTRDQSKLMIKNLRLYRNQLYVMKLPSIELPVIFPSPTSKKITINLTNIYHQIPIKFDIYSLNGTLIDSWINLNKMTYVEKDVSNYALGIYVIRITYLLIR